MKNDERLVAYVSSDVMQAIKKKAAEFGMDVSTYVRFVLLKELKSND